MDRRLLLSLLSLAAACAGAGRALPAPAPAAASESEWRALAAPRPRPLDGAPRIAVGELTLGEERPWGVATDLAAAVGLQELVGAGLTRRQDVHFVERRRFAAAAERERRGLPAPPGAPQVGTSTGVEMILTGSMTPFLGDSAWLELRLLDAASGGYRAAWRVGVPRGGDPTALARRITGGLVAVLDSLGARPAWSDPLPDAATPAWRPSGVPVAAFASFLRGVAAEDRYEWEAARRAYVRARELGGDGFFEPAVALARVARVRAGGTLGAG